MPSIEESTMAALRTSRPRKSSESPWKEDATLPFFSPLLLLPFSAKKKKSVDYLYTYSEGKFAAVVLVGVTATATTCVPTGKQLSFCLL